MLILYTSLERNALNEVFEMMLSISRARIQTVNTANNNNDRSHPIGGSHCT